MHATHRMTGRRTLVLLLLTAVAVAVITALTTVAAVAGSSYFNDVDPGATHEDGIAFMAETGVTAGCATPGGFCPSDEVTREQMATFMHRLSGHDDDVDPSVDAATLEGLTVSDIQAGIDVDDAPQTAWAYVDGETTTLERSSGVDSVSGGGGTEGRFTVTFDEPVDQCSFQATAAPTEGKGVVYLAGVRPGSTDHSVSVTIVQHETNEWANADFHLLAIC